MSTSRNAKTDDELITAAVGAHGVFFKKALIHTLKKIPGAQLVGEEHPVNYMGVGAIDILVEYTSRHNKFLFAIEAKRALATSKLWLFFPGERGVKLLYLFKGPELSTLSSLISVMTPNCSEGVEIDLDKMRKGDRNVYSSASADRVWQAAEQTCKGGLGFLKNEFAVRQRAAIREQELTKAPDYVFAMLIVTTAPLFVAELPAGTVDVSTGLHVDTLRRGEVPWLILDHPFMPPDDEPGHHLSLVQDRYYEPFWRGRENKEGILIVNAAKLRQLFGVLENLPTLK